ncbi:MAG: YicC family protein [Lachnospiraceae bacterium]|nr:YicC family protein [Lachnospiraceae bacterium]
MIRSMTGFGRGEATGTLGKVSVEMKSVNHRYLDLNIKMPRKFNPLEGNIRTYIKDKIARGKVDIYINYEDFSEDNVNIKYNRAIAKEYMDYFEQIHEEFGIENDVRVSRLASMPEVFSMEQAEDDEEGLWHLLSEALDVAVDKFITVRNNEGEQLKNDLLGKLDYMNSLVDQVEERYPDILADYRNRLTQKMQEILGNTGIDENRIAAEVVIYADKCCVDEETVRLRSHIKQVGDALQSDDSVGRKLDFLVQEMNREANTMLSKSTDMSLTDVAINLKTEIEKVREQIQNIE